MPDDGRYGDGPTRRGPDGDGAAPDGPPDGAGPEPRQPDPRGADLRGLARDWITLWQSELAAMAVDREAQETWHTMLALWAGAAGAMLTAAPRERPGGRSYRNPAGPAGAAAAPGTPAAAAAPDARDAEIERLARHVRELEARLADLEHGVRDGDGGHRRGAKRRRG